MSRISFKMIRTQEMTDEANMKQEWPAGIITEARRWAHEIFHFSLPPQKKSRENRIVRLIRTMELLGKLSQTLSQNTVQKTKDFF